MELMDILAGRAAPSPWSEGDNIPWHDPGFSQRMLREHLSQAHDRASRRLTKIDRQVAWIHEAVLGGEPTRVVDLGCGPGLYTSRLARRGHTCLGIDYSPASIRHAREEAQRHGLSCRYVLGDLREASYGADGSAGLVMCLFGEFNVFRPDHARLILAKAHQVLGSGGLLLLEPHTYAAVRHMGDAPPSWYASSSGLFAPSPHLVLMEGFWDAQSEAVTQRYWVVDAATGEVTRHAQSLQAYDREGYERVLCAQGFQVLGVYPSLLGEPDPEEADLMAIVARKAGAARWRASDG